MLSWLNYSKGEKMINVLKKIGVFIKAKGKTILLTMIITGVAIGYVTYQEGYKKGWWDAYTAGKETSLWINATNYKLDGKTAESEKLCPENISGAFITRGTDPDYIAQQMWYDTLDIKNKIVIIYIVEEVDGNPRLVNLNLFGDTSKLSADTITKFPKSLEDIVEFCNDIF